MYATVKDFEKIEDDLKELIPLGDGFDELKVETLILAASEDIDNYLRSQYATPLDPVPRTIARHCYNLTRFYLYSDFADTIPEDVETAFKRTKGDLNDISKGTSQLAGLNNNKPIEKADATLVKSESVFDVGYFN